MPGDVCAMAGAGATGLWWADGRAAVPHLRVQDAPLQSMTRGALLGGQGDPVGPALACAGAVGSWLCCRPTLRCQCTEEWLRGEDGR